MHTHTHAHACTRVHAHTQIGWYNAKNGPKGDQIFWLPFEELKKDQAMWVAKLADFLCVPTTPEIIDKVLAGSDFASMKGKTKDSNAEMAEATSRFRSGESGGWAKKFTKEQSAAMDALYAERVSVEAPGLQFDFGENPYESQEQDQKGSITM